MGSNRLPAALRLCAGNFEVSPFDDLALMVLKAGFEQPWPPKRGRSRLDKVEDEVGGVTSASLVSASLAGISRDEVDEVELSWCREGSSEVA